MQLQIHSNFRLDDAIREEMERRLRFALGRFVGRISLVTVGLADLNGPRHGMDKQCRVIVRLIPAGKVTIEEKHADASAAVALAADRVERSVDRELKRQRDTRYDRRSKQTLTDGLG
jgi:putative sigma-54 modulation protein